MRTVIVTGSAGLIGSEPRCSPGEGWTSSASTTTCGPASSGDEASTIWQQQKLQKELGRPIATAASTSATTPPCARSSARMAGTSSW